jgi:hypothetical protein
MTGVAADIGSMAWLIGRWAGRHEADDIEEYWNAALGGVMVGTFGAVRDGHPRFYEFLTIAGEDGSLVFRFRHFDPDLTAWEDKTEPMVFDLAEIGDWQAVFRRRGTERLMTYRLDDGGHLTVAFTTPGQAPDPGDEFRFARA